MPNVRIDRTPLGRNTAGALYERKEVAPDSQLELERRHGSLRQSRRGAALGITVPGDGYMELDIDIDSSGGLTMPLSLASGDITAATGTYPIINLDDSATGSHYRVYLERTDESTYSLVLAATNQTPTTQTDSFAVTPSTAYDLVLRLTGTTLSITDGTDTATITLSGTYTDDWKLRLLGREDFSKPESVHPVISGFGYTQSYIADESTVLGVRAPASILSYWYLDGRNAGAVIPDSINTGNGRRWLNGYPAHPVLRDSTLTFPGTQGAMLVRHTGEMDRYFQTLARSTAEDSWSVYIEGTMGRNYGAVNTILDYGDLILLEINASGQVECTINGTTMTSTTPVVGAGESFTIAAGRTGDQRFLQVDDGTTLVTTENSGTEQYPPYLDLQRIPNVYVGAPEDTTTETPFWGSLSKIALYPYETRRDSGATGASFYFDFADGELRDLSLNGTPAQLITHSAVSGEPRYTPGPQSDDEYVGIAGGLPLTGAGPAGYTTHLAQRVESDLTASRLGPLSFLVSSGAVTMQDSIRERCRTLGIETPGTNVSAKATSPGVLDGAVAYGYRYLTYNGTAGPVHRLDPVDATQGSRVILGSSVDGDDGSGTELGESYGETGSVGTNPDVFRGGNAAALVDGESHVAELDVRMPDYNKEDFKELVHHRGSRSTLHATSTARSFFQSPITAQSLDVDSNWTQQSVFRHQTPISESNRWQATPICALGGTGPASSDGHRNHNADFVAYIVNGHSTVGSQYGNGAGNERLVCLISRQKFDVAYRGGPGEEDNVNTNYYALTFTDDSWTAGNDYAVYFVRQGQALHVYQHDITNDTFVELTARSMNAYSGEASYGGWTCRSRSAYTGSTFFNGWSSIQPNRNWLFGVGGRARATIPFITEDTGSTPATDGQPEAIQGDTKSVSWTSAWGFLNPAPADVVHWHYRVWKRAYASHVLKANGLDRFAAWSGEPLHQEIFCDMAPIFEDTAALEDNFFDVGLGMGMDVRSAPNAPDTHEHFLQDTTDIPSEIPLLALDETATAFEDAAISIFFSALGDGTLTLRVGSDGTFAIPKRIWSPASANALYVKTVDDIRNTMGITLNDWDQFNWLSFGIDVVTDSGTSRFLNVNRLAINGDVAFDTAIGGATTDVDNWASAWIYVGRNITGTPRPTVRTNTAEFRLWADGEGPDLENNSGFDYLLSRVSENEYTGGTENLLHYIKFQPGDVDGTDLTNYGSEADWTIVLDAEVIDTRQVADSGADPEPVVAFPPAPHPDVVAIEIVRTAQVAATDPDSESDIQTALDTARAQPLYSLARIPIGTTFYNDNAPDGALGLPVSELDGFIPPNVLGASVWGGRLTLLGDKSVLYPAAPGAYGWESFPADLQYNIPVEDSGGHATAMVESQDRFNQSLLVVYGRTWAMLVGGDPDRPQPRSVGGAVGAYNQRCVASYSGMALSYNGHLWAIVNGEVSDLGTPVQDLLPSESNARLVVSGALASLYVVDTSSGDCLRYHFPTQAWSQEARDAIAVGDLADDVDAWIHVHGSYSKGDADTYGDDVDATTPATETGTISGDVVTLDTGQTVPLGVRVLVVDASDNEAVVRTATALTDGTALTFSSGDLAALSGTCTCYFGASADGLLLDTGPIDTNIENIASRLNTELLESSSWEATAWASSYPGDRSTVISGLTWTSVTDTLGLGVRGRFLRTAIRNRAPEASRASLIELDITDTQ